MNYFLKFDFENAGLFSSNKKSRDYIYPYQKKSLSVKRSTMESYIEPITKFQVSNMIHVLFGERPVPSLRNSNNLPYGIINEYMVMAENSYLKINTPKINPIFVYESNENLFEELKTLNNNGSDFDFKYETENIEKTLKSGKKKSKTIHKFYDYIGEVLILNKAVGNSNIKTDGFVTWEKIKIRLGNDIFNEYVNTVKSDIHLNPLEYSFKYIYELICDSDRINLNLLFEKYSDIKYKLKTVIGSLTCNYGLNHFSANGNTVFNKRLNNKGIECNYKNLSGSIIVPMNDEQYMRFKKISSGFTNLLDGGFLIFDDVYDEYSFSNALISNYRGVGEISTKKILK